MPDSSLAKRRITLGLLLGLFLAALEVSVVSTAMPRLIADLGGQHLYSLPFALYLLLSTVSGPLWGHGSDRGGRRALYLASVLTFLSGSALCGASISMPMLVAARALQGLGAGGLQTLTFTIIGELYPLEKRASIQGYISGVWGVSALIGPLVGGFIVDHFSWRWVFYLNLPFGLAAMLLVARALQDTPHDASHRLDWWGALHFALSAGLLVCGLQLHLPWLTGAGLLLLLFFPALEARQADPLLPLNVLRTPLIGRAVLGNIVASVAFFGLTTFLPLYMQSARGLSATSSGAILSPTTLGWVTASILASRLLVPLGPRLVCQLGAGLMCLGFLSLQLTLHYSTFLVGASGLMVGLGMGGTMLALLVAAQEESPRALLGIITASILFSRNIGASLGSAFMATLLGPALETGGQPLLQAFWRIPAFALFLSFTLFLLVYGLPPIRRNAHG